MQFSEPQSDESMRRPGWMTVLAVLCAATLLVTLFRDLFVPAARAVEVWFGFEVTGWPAYATAPLHWAIFAVATWAFWTGRTWIAPWAAAYLFYAAASHLVWSEASPHGRGWPIGLVQAALISAGAYFILCLKALETPPRRTA
jgi:hypothetical protein